MNGMRSDRGFTLLHVVVVFVILALAAAAGLRLWYENQDKDTVLKASITSFDECVAAGNPVMESFPEQCAADGKTFTKEYNLGKLTDECTLDGDITGRVYTHPSGSYELCIPNGWALYALVGVEDEKTSVFADDNSLGIKPGLAPKLKLTGGKGGASTLQIFQQSINEDNGWMTAGYEKTGSLEAAKSVATIYSYTETKEDSEENQAIDKLPKGTESTAYIFETDSRIINIHYNHFPDETDRSELIRSVAATMKIN